MSDGKKPEKPLPDFGITDGMPRINPLILIDLLSHALIDSNPSATEAQKSAMRDMIEMVTLEDNVVTPEDRKGFEEYKTKGPKEFMKNAPLLRAKRAASPKPRRRKNGPAAG